LSSFRPARIGNRLNIGLRQLYPLLGGEQRVTLAKKDIEVVR
jgi:hypothetical protein